MKKSFAAFICYILITALPISALAHPGNTDANGGHYCWTNCERWGLKYGEYHYNNGDTSTGNTTTVKSGWQSIGGKWYYYLSGKVHKGWLADGNSWYYLDNNGVMQTGWKFIGGQWYYLNTTGAMKTGWLYDQGWYYLKNSGEMANGWVKDGGSWYYFSPSGLMKTGWLKDGGTWYYLTSNGSMKTGWVMDGGLWYYLDKSGAMKTGWLWDNAWYYLDFGGQMKTGWLQLGEDHYYLNQNGTMAHDTVVDGLIIGSDGKANKINNDLFNSIKSVANNYGFTVDYDKEIDTFVISNNDGIIALAYSGYIGGYSQYIDFIATAATKMGAPEPINNIFNFFDKVSNPENPRYYQHNNFGINYDRESGWVNMLWNN